ncbi:MAG: translation initiation factor IF-3 [Dehalococcoidia bacterium]|nr:translation initiation factor IF-3 [Dehalococcoidia bacterium]
MVCYSGGAVTGVPPRERRRRRQGRAIAKDYRVNERIRIPEVRVVDEQGEQLGVMPTRDALALARQRELDLVEVAPNSSPPVCRLLDYGKFRYLQTTKEREMRRSSKANRLHQVRMRPRIGRHDIEAKERLARRLLEGGAKVKVTVLFRGREIVHPELAVNLLRKVAESLRNESKVEQAPEMEGRMMSIILAPVKSAKAVKPSADGTVAVAEGGDAEDQDA